MSDGTEEKNCQREVTEHFKKMTQMFLIITCLKLLEKFPSLSFVN